MQGHLSHGVRAEKSVQGHLSHGVRQRRVCKESRKCS